MVEILNRLKSARRRVSEIIAARRPGAPPCGACGFRGQALHHDVLWPELVQAWELTPEWARWIDEREGSRCALCGSSLRSALLARAIVDAVNDLAGTTARHLRASFRDRRARALRIAEINSAGDLHRYLARCDGLRYSEYGSRDPRVPSESLTRLSYADASFDLVITSDTLEHVPDIDLALRETLRILAPGGMHVFSTPVVWDRPTRQRARMDGEHVTHLLPPSYHGAPQGDATDLLVFYELGHDFVARCEAAGFELRLVRDAHNPALVSFIARRPH